MSLYVPFVFVSKSWPCAYLVKHYAMKAYGGVGVEIHIFLTSALVGLLLSQISKVKLK
jgi:hypothetical protein